MFITNIMANKTMSFGNLMNTKQILSIYLVSGSLNTQMKTDKNIELNKMYSKKFNTDYMILGDPHEKIKIIHYLGPRNAK